MFTKLVLNVICCYLNISYFVIFDLDRFTIATGCRPIVYKIIE